MAERPRTWGFRLSAVDALVLAATPSLTWAAWDLLAPLGGAIPFAVGHFFLFCNVFRVHRRKELLWAAAALVLWPLCAASPQMAWWWPFAAQAPLTVSVIVWELRGPGYHGILARRINGRLDDYLNGGVS